VNGVEADLNSWPSIANLFLQSANQVGGNQGSQCGGTIIHNHWVITAAHCCENMVRVSSNFGQGNQGEFEAGEFALEASVIINHPDYTDGSDGSLQNMDYCLLKFDDDIIAMGSNGNTAIACLPDAAVGTTTGGNGCWVAGWGTTSYGGSISLPLLSIGVNVFSHQYCFDKTGHQAFPDDICAGIPDNDGDGFADGGKDSCQGDSGGPLMCPINGKATLVAVVSRGQGCADPGTSGIYSATFFVKQWIADTIASN